jgi:hypothetical protein
MTLTREVDALLANSCGGEKSGDAAKYGALRELLVALVVRRPHHAPSYTVSQEAHACRRAKR